MKKFFTFIAALMAVVAVNATVVTLTPSDFTACENQENFSATVKGITVGITKTTITADQIRIFKNQTITISAESEISGIVFTCTANGAAQYGPGCFAEKEGYSFSGKVGTWAGTAATSVDFLASSNQVRATKIEVYLDGEKPAGGEVETIEVDVAGAIAAGMALDSMKTSEALYEVTGYVVDAQAYNPTYKNQIWFMSDDAENTGAQKFEAYACTVSEGGTVMQVLNGDKVTLTGNLTKYYDQKASQFLIEIKNGTAIFVSKTEGDHSIDGGDTPAQDLDTISVAKALEIGGALAADAKTDVAYVIHGYVSDIVEVYATATDYETFWMVDEKGGRAKTNADGAFEVYRGNPTQKMTAGLDGHVYVTAKIQNYKGNTIETSGATTINIVEQGTVEEVESIDVAKALEIGKALASGAVSDKRYEITGYVSNVYTFFNPDFGNETVWITDDPTSTAASLADGAFEIYRGKPDSKAEVGYGAKVSIICKIKNYNGTTIENDGSNVPFEVLEASTYVPDTVSIEEAAALIQNLAEGAKLPKYNVVKGFIQSVVTPYDASSNTATYKLADFPNDAEGAVQAYKATILKADKDKVVANNYVSVIGYLMKKSGAAQIAQGAVTTFEEAPVMDTIYVNVEEAIAEGLKLPVGDKSERIYAVTGFVNFVAEEFADGMESFFLADDAASEAMTFYAKDATIAEAAAEGQKVQVIGRLQNADGEIVTIENGKARIAPAEGIENIVLTEKVQKVVVDGAIYIVRDGKMFNLQGAQVR